VVAAIRHCEVPAPYSCAGQIDGVSQLSKTQSHSI
jgi:hypothetical protein